MSQGGLVPSTSPKKVFNVHIFSIFRELTNRRKINSLILHFLPVIPVSLSPSQADFWHKWEILGHLLPVPVLYSLLNFYLDYPIAMFFFFKTMTLIMISNLCLQTSPLCSRPKYLPAFGLLTRITKRSPQLKIPSTKLVTTALFLSSVSFLRNDTIIYPGAHSRSFRVILHNSFSLTPSHARSFLF